MKNILLISQNSLSLHANNGKTLTNIFQKWDKDNLAQLYFQDEIPESLKFDNFSLNSPISTPNFNAK